MENTHELLKKYEKARNKYKPEKVKVVFVAEAPPDSVKRFFYHEDVRTADWLFLGIMGVLYPEAKEVFMRYKRSPQIKKLILRQFQCDGYYLLDLFELPLSLNRDSEQIALRKLIAKLDGICDEPTQVVLIKADVYDIAFDSLKRRFKVVNKRIPFPSSGQQGRFKVEFESAMEEVGNR